VRRDGEDRTALLEVLFLFYLTNKREPLIRQHKDTVMRHDPRLRATARVIYDAWFPTEDTAPVGFDQAERFGTIHYRRAVEAAQECIRTVAQQGEQLALL
jgi:hypothetical protein